MKKAYERPHSNATHMKSDCSLLTGSINFGGVNNQNGESADDFVKNGDIDDQKHWYQQ